ncbi:phage tail protein [Fibrella forsythiae]|uniref:Phage tail protein n=1 Tax=Fibrella forsythiae TaxID=2817061 RepID=A0ABS3JB85_9BACT|nr:phage tail protein [Fibrella forsythiae]MBO0947250.1 phage tail protein [Fibrella forsythiae]
MAALVVTKQTGETLRLQRKGSLITIVEAKQSRTLLGDDMVSITVESAEPLDFDINDAIAVFGERYRLNKVPSASRDDKKRVLVYELVFYGSQYNLRDLQYFNLDVLGYSSGAEFSLTGDLALFVSVLMNNIHRAYPDWTLGEVKPNTAVKTLTFSNENCLAVLQKLCKEYATEFEMVRVSDSSCTLHLRPVGNLLSHVFEYGRGKGLYAISRGSVSKDYITRLYAFGGNKNLPTGYRNNAPQLRLSTDGSWIENEAAKQAFGLIEGTMQFEDIYPHRTGTIASVSSDGLSFTDPGVDFDLNDYLQPNTTAKMSVKTGPLAGRGFEISSYIHATKTFTIIPFKDDRDQTYPAASVFVLEPGNTYVLLEIIMPQSYVDAAEAELAIAAKNHLDANCAPRVQYAVEVSESYLKRLDAFGSVTNFFTPGDYIQMVDQTLNINKTSRVLSVEREVFNPNQYSLTVADSYEVTIIEQLLATQSEIKTIIRINDLPNSKKALYGWKIGQELLGLFFDTDGQFDGSKIRPETIEAGSLAIGAKSQQLILNVVIEPNYNGLANSVRVNAGSLTHYTIVDSGPKTWQLSAQVTSLNDNNARYIYAKCNRTNPNEALISFDTVQRKVDSDATYYYFLIGYLHTVIDGVRFISLTYGATTINGRFIRTGRIMSADGSTYFDLDTGEIGGRIIFTGNGGGDSSLEQLEAEFTYFQNVTIPNMRKSLKGLTVSYFQETDPNTWAEYDRANHDGDQWYKPSTKQLFTYSKTSNSWVPNTDKTAVAAYEKASQAKDTADGKRRNFIVQPYTPYDEGDLWTDGTDLRKCINSRGASQQFNALDWDRATKYDSTKTVIDGGMVTSGTIQLSSILGTIRAGITGVGNLITSVRFWAGASFDNREFAPFRVLDSGEVFARKRIEMMNENNVGQAGISGSNSALDGLVRFWAGSTWENRATAPFQVFADGAVRMIKGLLGKLTLSEGGLSAVDGDSSVQLDINKPLPGVASFLQNMRSISITSDPAIKENTALYLEAANTANPASITGLPPVSYALYSPRGKVMTNEGLFNGRAGKYAYATANRTYIVDARLNDVVPVYTASGRLDIVVSETQSIKNGKEITFVNLNDQVSDVYLKDVIRGTANYQIQGGWVVTIIHFFGFWYVKSTYNNDWPNDGLTPPNADQ